MTTNKDNRTLVHQQSIATHSTFKSRVRRFPWRHTTWLKWPIAWSSDGDERSANPGCNSQLWNDENSIIHIYSMIRIHYYELIYYYYLFIFLPDNVWGQSRVQCLRDCGIQLRVWLRLRIVCHGNFFWCVEIDWRCSWLSLRIMEPDGGWNSIAK